MSAAGGAACCELIACLTSMWGRCEEEGLKHLVMKIWPSEGDVVARWMVAIMIHDNRTMPPTQAASSMRGRWHRLRVGAFFVNIGAKPSIYGHQPNRLTDLRSGLLKKMKRDRVFPPQAAAPGGREAALRTHLHHHPRTPSPPNHLVRFWPGPRPGAVLAGETRQNRSNLANPHLSGNLHRCSPAVAPSILPKRSCSTVWPHSAVLPSLN